MESDRSQHEDVSPAAMHELLCKIAAVVAASSLDVIEAFDEIATLLAHDGFGPVPAEQVDDAWSTGDWPAILAGVRAFVPAASGENPTDAPGG